MSRTKSTTPAPAPEATTAVLDAEAQEEQLDDGAVLLEAVGDPFLDVLLAEVAALRAAVSAVAQRGTYLTAEALEDAALTGATKALTAAGMAPEEATPGE